MVILGEQCPEGSLADVEGFQDREASARFVGRRGKPCLQVCFRTEKIHERAAHLRNTTSVLFGEPDDEGRGRSLIEEAFRHVHRDWRVTEETRGANARPLPQHTGDTQGINGAHGVPHRASFEQHLMCGWALREGIGANDVGRASSSRR